MTRKAVRIYERFVKNDLKRVTRPRGALVMLNPCLAGQYQNGHLSILVKQISPHTLRPFRRALYLNRRRQPQIGSPREGRNLLRPHKSSPLLLFPFNRITSRVTYRDFGFVSSAIFFRSPLVSSICLNLGLL